MNPSVAAVFGLTAFAGFVIAVLVFAVVRFAMAARRSNGLLRERTTESAFVTAALQDAVTRLKAQERVMSARAEASERLSSEIVESLASGLLVVDSQGHLRIVNPAGRRLLGLPADAVGRPCREVLPADLSSSSRNA